MRRGPIFIFFFKQYAALLLGAAVSLGATAGDEAIGALERKYAEGEAQAAQWTPESNRTAAALFREVIAGAQAAGATELGARATENLVRLVEDDRERLELLRQAIALRESLGDRAAAARSRVKIGAALSRLGDKAAATKTLEEVLPVLHEAGDVAGEAGALNELGVIDYWSARYDEAVARHAAAFALIENGGDSELLGITLNLLARSHSKKGQDRAALEMYRRAYEVAGTVSDATKRELARIPALANMANTHLDLGEADRAEPLLEEAAALVEARQTPGLLEPVLTLRGKARAVLGELGPALDDLTRVRARYRESGNRVREANTVGLLGDVYRDVGDAEKAHEHHRAALALVRTLGDKLQEAQQLFRVGDDLAALGRGDEAVPPLEEALALTRASGDRPLEARALARLGEVRQASGRTEDAFDAFTQALALYRSSGGLRGEGTVLTSLGRLHARKGERGPADDCFVRALERLRAAGHRAGEAQALYERAALFRDGARLEEARDASSEALAIVESLRGTITGDTLRASLLASRQEYYEQLVDVLLRLDARDSGRGHAAAAFAVSERARARSLLDTLRERGANLREGVDAALIAQEGALRQKLSARAGRYEGVEPTLLEADARIERRLRSRGARQQRLTERPADAAERAAVAEEIAALLDEHREIQRRIRAASPRYAALTQPPPAPIEDVQQKVLDGDTALLEYFLGAERGVLWLVTRDSVDVFELPPRRAVEDAARDLYGCLKARGDVVEFESARERRGRLAAADARLPRAAQALSAMILAPLGERMLPPRLLIVAHGALQYVPFAALTRPGRPAPLLVEHEIVYAASASVLMELRAGAPREGRSEKDLAVLADPVFGDAYPRLPHTRVEAAELVRLAGKDRTVTALGLDANRDAIAGPAFAGCRIVHLATHAFVDGERPEMSGLVLSLVDAKGRPDDRGILRLHDIYDLKLDADLVVLSACQTALGQEVRGEGLVGLTRGFLYAGARRVVASLWSSPDEATAVLMSAFYRNLLKRGLTPPAALRAAQLSLRRSGRWTAYDWAGFIVQGDWR
jgi:CHAT domain-containing protein/tetratricopeptide (TPR) repeat protein